MDGDSIINVSDLTRLSSLVPSLLNTLSNKIDKIEHFIATKLADLNGSEDRWLNASQARKYMGDMSKATFDKYRYKTSPKLDGHKLDGKVLYKKSDLDRFIRLYEFKSEGFA